MSGRIVQLNVSQGGVPKRPIPRGRVGPLGLEGDRQRDRKHHGGPERALSLFSFETIERLRAEGHPIEPGAVGENLTLGGIDFRSLGPGARLRLGATVLIEVTRVPA
jgi:MOSC domain-containing protein YiiM